ncbi:hypothetical protein TNCV_13811 [Trichonephila clavipes]|nr:hypothetical protein TNCV_13811 [Trichonephila clavipes]
MLSTSSIPVVFTSSSSTQIHLLPSTSSVIPATSSESQLPISISTTTSGNSVNTFASSLCTEDQPTVPLLNTASAKSNS